MSETIFCDNWKTDRRFAIKAQIWARKVYYGLLCSRYMVTYRMKWEYEQWLKRAERWA